MLALDEARELRESRSTLYDRRDLVLLGEAGPVGAADDEVVLARERPHVARAGLLRAAEEAVAVEGGRAGTAGVPPPWWRRTG